MWWWIEPLTATGAVCLILAGIWTFIFQNTEHKFFIIVALILFAPFIIAALAAIINMLVYIFIMIWKPYF